MRTIEDLKFKNLVILYYKYGGYNLIISMIKACVKIENININSLELNEENGISNKIHLLYNEALNELDDRLFDLEDLTLDDLLGEENIATIPIGKYYRLFIEDTKNDLLVEIIDNYGDIIDTLEGVTRETKAYELKKEGIRVLKCL